MNPSKRCRSVGTFDCNDRTSSVHWGETRQRAPGLTCPPPSTHTHPDTHTRMTGVTCARLQIITSLSWVGEGVLVTMLPDHGQISMFKIEQHLAPPFAGFLESPPFVHRSTRPRRQESGCVHEASQKIIPFAVLIVHVLGVPTEKSISVSLVYHQIVLHRSVLSNSCLYPYCNVSYAGHLPICFCSVGFTAL